MLRICEATFLEGADRCCISAWLRTRGGSHSAWLSAVGALLLSFGASTYARQWNQTEDLFRESYESMRLPSENVWKVATSGEPKGCVKVPFSPLS